MFVRFGSNVAAKADALFVRNPTEAVVFVWMKLNGFDVDEFVEVPASGVTVKIKLVDCPFVSVGKTGHVTTPFLLVPPADALAKTRFVGNLFVTSVLIAIEGPPLLTMSV